MLNFCVTRRERGLANEFSSFNYRPAPLNSFAFQKACGQERGREMLIMFSNFRSRRLRENSSGPASFVKYVKSSTCCNLRHEGVTVK